jgi:hypothetical protein
MPLFLLVDTFLRFVQDSFEKREEATRHFSKSFVKMLEMYQPIGRKG